MIPLILWLIASFNKKKICNDIFTNIFKSCSQFLQLKKNAHKHIHINFNINRIFQRIIQILLVFFTCFISYKCLFGFFGPYVIPLFVLYYFYYQFLIFEGCISIQKKEYKLFSNYSEELDYDDIDQNDAKIGRIQTKVDDLKHKIDTYTLESALLGALSLTAYLQPFTSNVIKQDTFIKTIYKINDIVHYFLIFEFKLSFTSIIGLFHDTNFLWSTITILSIFCSVLYLLLLVSRKRIYTQISSIVKDLELSKNFNVKEEDLNNIIIQSEGKNLVLEERLKDVSTQCKKHLYRCDDIIPKMNSSFQILETLRSLANSMFILLVCVAAFLISIYIGFTLFILTVIMQALLLVDLKKFYKELNADKTFKRAKEYLTKGKQFYNVNQNDKAKKEFEKIINLFDGVKIKHEILLAETYMFRGLILSGEREFDKATEEYNHAINNIGDFNDNRKKNWTTELKSGIHYNMGTNYRRKAQNYENSEDKEIALNKALKSYEDSLELRKKSEGDVSSSYRAIAAIYKMKKDYNKALENYDLAIEKYRQNIQNKLDDGWIATTIESKGSVYFEKFIDSKGKSDFESAKKFFEESLQIREDLKANSPENVYLSEKLFSYKNIATLHRLNAEFLEKDDKTEAKDEFKTALASYNKSLEIEEKLDGDRDFFKGNLHYIIGITNIGLEQYQEAINCLRKSAELRKKINKETKDCIDKIESIITNIEDNEIKEWLKKFKTQNN